MVRKVTAKPAKAEKLPAGFKRIESSQWSVQALDQILKRIQNRSALVIGDVGIDRYTLGSVDRISPEAPVPIVLVQEERLKLGLAANVADNVRALGGRALLVGVVGKDRHGSDFRALLRAEGISPQYLVTDATRRTVLKERIVSDRQQLLRVDYETLHGLSRKLETEIFAQVARLISRAEVVILEDYAKGFLSPALASKIYREAARVGKMIAVDPNARSPLSLYRGAKLLTPNTKEAEALSGVKISDLNSLREAGECLLRETGGEHVVITRGRDGMAIFSKPLAKAAPVVRLIPTYAREVYDVSGAGDTVISMVGLGLAAGASIEDACVLGNLAAAIEVGKRGTATVTPAEIREAFGWFKSP